MPLAPVGPHRIHYELHGDAPGTPLVLVMGLGGSSRGWLALQVPELAPVHRTVVYDHRGVGESEDPGGTPEFEACATVGKGVFETLKAVAKGFLTDLRKMAR